MKNLLLILALFVGYSFAGNCTTEKKYYPKMKMSLDRVVGNYDCVLDDVMEDDLMLAGYWVEDKTKTMFLVINNFRAGKKIDLDFYGFDKRYKNSLLSRIDNLKDIKLIERYSFNGSEKPQIEKNLKKEGWRR